MSSVIHQNAPRRPETRTFTMVRESVYEGGPDSVRSLREVVLPHYGYCSGILLIKISNI